MRILIKGGVWKNTEDEILKAAVMKYGLNQWARISSLLTRKSAKQCKARWYEWLDPAIRKTEWTREEDERLLHLAKLMPTQWRTVAPLVGRTPAQCLERYERLLDAAAGRAGGYDARDDPRRLRPGEIDPNPEGKPARPDAVDMDEDEKEMLSEARARLANTRGKKAKRKARERALEEARRLAALQKKRELKAAGIEVREKARRGGVDYNAEVAFERRPAPGFYAVDEEEARTRAVREEFRPVAVEEIEGKKRRDIEAALIKEDRAKGAMAAARDGAGAVARALAAAEAEAPRRRGRMMLPAPQVSDAELEVIARGGGGAGGGGGGGDATRGLLGDYPTPHARLPTPAAPAAASVGAAGGLSRLEAEAAVLAALRAGQTPLLGGDGPELGASDFSGAMPTPRGGAPGATPARGGAAAAPALPAPTPTPARDELGLNDPSAFACAGAGLGRRAAAAAAALARNELRAGLAQLPAPQHEYAVAAPEAPSDEEMGEAEEEDAAERDARRRAAAAAAVEAELARRPASLRRGLPRPAALDGLPRPPAAAEAAAAPLAVRAAGLLAAEMLAMLEHDAAAYPPGTEGGGGKRPREGEAGAPPPPPLERFVDAELDAARALLAAEAEAVRAAMGHAGATADEYAAAAAAAAADALFSPSLGRYVRAATAAPEERLAALRADFDAALREMRREAARAAKLEARAATVTGGLAARAERLRADAEAAAGTGADARVELACFRALHEQEGRAAPERIEALAALAAAQAARERALQARYAAARRARDDLLRAEAAAA